MLALSPEVVNDTLGSLLKYQDDIARIQGSEAARIIEQIKRELQASAAVWILVRLQAARRPAPPTGPGRNPWPATAP